MVKVVAEFFIKEDALEEAHNFLTELVAETRKEKGCITYDVFADNSNKTHLVLIEEWESQEILDIHSASTHFMTLVPKIVDLSAKPPVITGLSRLI